MSLKSGLRELEKEIMAVKSFALDQFFIIKQSAKKNTGHLLSPPSGDNNSVLKTSLLDQIKYLEKELSHKNNIISCLLKYDKPLLVSNQKSSRNSNSDKIIKNSFSDSNVTNRNGTSTNLDRDITGDTDFTIDNNNVNHFSENTTKEFMDTKLPRIVKQLQDVRAEQHLNFINHQNEEAKAQEAKNRFMITDVKIALENISAESPKESKNDDIRKVTFSGEILSIFLRPVN